MANETVCAIVLAYGSRTDAARAIDSLSRAIHRGKTIVVQNGLTDLEMAGLSAEFPDICVLRNPTNLGVTAGRNLAIHRARELAADYYFFLDRDAYVEPDAVDHLVRVCESQSDAGLVSCLILAANNPSQVHSAGGTFDRETLKEIHHRSYPAAPITAVDFVVTTAALVRAAVLDQVGMFDERYFAYQEDIDWSFSARERGYRHYLVRDAVGYHDEARSRFRPLVAYYITRNKLLFWLKHGYIRGKHDPRIWRFALLTTSYYARHAMVLAPFAFGCLRAHWQGLFDFLSDRFGRGPAWIERPDEGFLESKVREIVLNSFARDAVRAVRRRLR